MSQSVNRAGAGYFTRRFRQPISHIFQAAAGIAEAQPFHYRFHIQLDRYLYLVNFVFFRINQFNPFPLPVLFLL
jgi:hypothetical protein